MGEYEYTIEVLEEHKATVRKTYAYWKSLLYDPFMTARENVDLWKEREVQLESAIKKLKGENK